MWVPTDFYRVLEPIYIRYNHLGSGIDPSASARALTIDYRPSSIYRRDNTTMPLRTLIAIPAHRGPATTIKCLNPFCNPTSDRYAALRTNRL